MSQENLSSQIVKALESGVNKHLDRSILYSPLNFFYTRFKKNNPQTINHARDIVKSDVMNLLTQIPNFNAAIFFDGEEINPLGKKLLNRNYTIGINLLKKQLSVITAFRVITNSHFRLQTYNFILSQIQKSILSLINSPQLSQ